MTTTGSIDTPQDSILFKQFLETVHPSVLKVVSGVHKTEISQLGKRCELITPDLRLHCPTCEGSRTFRCSERHHLRPEVVNGEFVSYLCGDCQKATKLFSVWISLKDRGRAEVYKYGENPPFGVPVPKKLLRLFGRDAATFLKGRQCENQGLGIGAFSYYRRMVQNHKDEIFGEIIKVCETLKASPTLIEELRRARQRVSFTEGMEEIKTALPDGLHLDGHNPLTALHGALSAGLHNESDEECLEAASAVRLVLTDLVERMSLLRQEKAELNKAVQLLISKRGKTK